MRRIDAHQHFWHVVRRDYAWLTEDAFPVLYRDFDPEDLAPLLDRCGVQATVLVQGAETDSETEFLLGIANTTDFVAGVVGWADLTSADAPQRIQQLADHPKLVAVRPMLELIADENWVLGSNLTPALDAIAEQGLCFDALIRPKHLSAIRRLLERHPDLAVVIDHGAKPAIADGELSDWAQGMRAIAADSKACCKISGLITEANWSDWTAETLKPYVAVLLDCFGPGRLMWGSDWPVLNVAGNYEQWFAVAEDLTAELSTADKAMLFGGTAERFYGLTAGV